MTNYFRAFYYLNKLQRQAYWKAKKLQEYQNKRLRHIMKYSAEHSLFYKNIYKKFGFDPNEVKNKYDLNRLPIIRKDDIRPDLKGIISDEFDARNLKCMSTSGSTGEPLFIYLSDSEIEYRKAKHLRANISVGQKPWDRWVTLTGPQHFSKSTRLQRLIRLYVPTTVSVFKDVVTQYSMIEKLKPNVLDGYSSSLLLLAQQAERGEVKTINPRFLIGGAELIDAHSVKYIEKVFQVPFYDQYSSVEFERIAWQCPKKRGYHIDADGLVLQFLDKNGEEVSAGESGEVVVTSLFNYAMPLIRYGIGDVGTPSDEVCDCGRTLPLMQMVEGRKESLLHLPNGQLVTPRAFTYALHEFEFYYCIEKFRIVQKKLNVFEFILKLKENGIKESGIERALVSHLGSIFKSEELVFEIKFVGDIPLEKSGKLKAVISELNSNNHLKDIN